MKLDEIINFDSFTKGLSAFKACSETWELALNEGSIPKVIGTLNGFDIHFMKCEKMKAYLYGLFDPKTNNAIMIADLSPFGKSGKVFQINLIGIDDSYRGLNFPVKLYSWIIKERNFALMTGYQQTIGGRSIWEKLGKIPHIFIFGYNTKTKESFQIDQRNLFNEDLYTDDIQDEIAQLYAEIDEIYKEDPSNTKEMFRLQKKINALADRKSTRLNSSHL